MGWVCCWSGLQGFDMSIGVIGGCGHIKFLVVGGLICPLVGGRLGLVVGRGGLLVIVDCLRCLRCF